MSDPTREELDEYGMPIMPEPTCACGSGLYPDWEYDGHGIPLCKCCDDCRADKLKGFRPDIMEAYEADEPIDED